MNIPEGYYYSKEHTWLKIEGDTALVGISDFAQDNLGEIVYVDLPAIGKHFAQDEIFGTVEALKTTSDLYMPVNGEVIETNPALKDNPTLVNTDPFIAGWILKIKLLNPADLDNLLLSSDYQKLIV